MRTCCPDTRTAARASARWNVSGSSHPYARDVVDQETLRALRDASRELLVEVDLIALYLVGSRARGDRHADSDIDVAVLPRAAVPDPLGLPAEVADRLEGALGRGPVDVVVLDVDRLGLPLLGSLLRDAVVVASADEPARIDFEVRSMALVLDLEVCTGPLRAELLARTATGLR